MKSGSAAKLPLLMTPKCEVCHLTLAPDETWSEHVVSVHLTLEGLCNICGEDSFDFVNHFNVHLLNC